MAIMVRNNDNIMGISIGDSQHKISQFADDTTCYVADSASMIPAIDTLELFSRFLRLHINLDKSSIIPIGRVRPTPPPNLGINVAEKVKILSIWHANGRSVQSHYEWNFRPILEKMRTYCSSWSNRTLSLKGKPLFSIIWSSPSSNMSTLPPTPLLRIYRSMTPGRQFHMGRQAE